MGEQCDPKELKDIESRVIYPSARLDLSPFQWGLDLTLHSDETHFLVIGSSESLFLFDIPTQRLVSQISSKSISPNLERFKQISVCAQDNLVWAAIAPKSIVLLDLRTNTPCMSLTTRTRVETVTNNNESLLAAGEIFDGESNLLIWDTRNIKASSLEPSAMLSYLHSDDITVAKFSDLNLHVLASGSTDGLISILNTQYLGSDEDILTYTLPYESVSNLGFFGPMHEYLHCTSHMETMCIWDIQEALKIASFGQIRAEDDISVRSLVSVSYDNNLEKLDLVSSSSNGTGFLFNVKLEGYIPEAILKGHSDIIRGAQICRRRGLMLTTGEDGSVIFWNI